MEHPVLTQIGAALNMDVIHELQKDPVYFALMMKRGRTLGRLARKLREIEQNPPCAPVPALKRGRPAKTA